MMKLNQPYLGYGTVSRFKEQSNSQVFDMPMISTSKGLVIKEGTRLVLFNEINRTTKLLYSTIKNLIKDNPTINFYYTELIPSYSYRSDLNNNEYDLFIASIEIK